MLQFRSCSFVQIRLDVPNYFVVVTGEDERYYRIAGPYTNKQNAEERFENFKTFYQTSSHWKNQREQGCVVQLIEIRAQHTLIK